MRHFIYEKCHTANLLTSLTYTISNFCIDDELDTCHLLLLEHDFPRHFTSPVSLILSVTRTISSIHKLSTKIRVLYGNMKVTCHTPILYIYEIWKQWDVMIPLAQIPRVMFQFFFRFVFCPYKGRILTEINVVRVHNPGQ